MSQSVLFSVVLPVFCFIGLGYLVITVRLIGAATGEAVAVFVFNVAIPFLLFRAIGTMEIAALDPWPFWLAYFGVAAVNFALGVVIIRKGFGRDGQAGVIAGLCASYSNVVMVGMPVVAAAFGEAGLVTMLLLIAVHLPVMMTASAVLFELTATGPREERGLGKALLRVLKNLARNPMIIAILAGIAFRFSGLSLEGIPRDVVDGVSDTAIPLALISLGMSLHRYGVKGNVLPAVALGVTKLAVMPVLAFVVARYVFELPPLGVAIVVVGAACPTGANAYLMANRMQTGLALSANTITLTTAISVLTMGFWLSLLL
ncbi:MAG: AEC family transporter [Pseudomonadota bacterium]